MDILELKGIWNNIRLELRDVIPSQGFYAWFEAIEVVGYENGMLSLITALQLAPTIVRQMYYKQVIGVLKKHFGDNVDFDLRYDADFAEKYHKEKKKTSGKAKIQKQEDEEDSQKQSLDNLAKMQSFSNLNLKYKFENYVVGENNRFAHAVAMAVAKNPAKKYNPLFIYGGSGLGKTHLMQAIGHYVLFNKSKLRVRYIKTEDYYNEVIKNIQCSDRVSRMDKFRQKYRNVDVLLIDDIQFLESKKATMDEIFHTFDSLHNNNKQIVITSDRLPKDIPTLPDRLRTRFEMGLMVDITPPDFETRVAILKNLGEQQGMDIPFEVYEYIANNFVSNVRELEGAFNKVSAYADIEGIPVTIEFTKKVLNCEVAKKEFSISDVAEIVADYYGVTVDDFKSTSRNQKVSSSRQVAVYMARTVTEQSFENIAEFFNKKHPTMLYAYDQVKGKLKVNRELERTVSELNAKIKEM